MVLLSMVERHPFMQLQTILQNLYKVHFCNPVLLNVWEKGGKGWAWGRGELVRLVERIVGVIHIHFLRKGENFVRRLPRSNSERTLVRDLPPGDKRFYWKILRPMKYPKAKGGKEEGECFRRIERSNASNPFVFLSGRNLDLVLGRAF